MVADDSAPPALGNDRWLCGGQQKGKEMEDVLCAARILRAPVAFDNISC